MLTIVGTSPFAVAAIASAVVGIILVIAGVLALLGLHPVGFVVRASLGLVFLALGGAAGAIAVGVGGYRELTHEEVAAHLSVRPTGPQHFSATVRFPDGTQATFPVAGDEIYVDAHILKWKPVANMLGLRTAYELGRIQGRYRAIDQERSGARTVHSLGRERAIDLFELRQSHVVLGPLLDAEYGSATFVPVTRPIELEVRVSTTGLLMRETSPGR